uniref:Uncharacterized protein n=1 Tax=Rhizophora mucronata TaxID=61149 RepID=A0A2P2JPD5_RHIMU
MLSFPFTIVYFVAGIRLATHLAACLISWNRMMFPPVLLPLDNESSASSLSVLFNIVFCFLSHNVKLLVLLHFSI